ncbi:WbqC family protein [Flavobacteriaceae bacterium]|nr:WbqC family protein [Flavobacteriaceae bacterium]MDB4050605.1 WbqC family protein [Flavobacteriaceae bacterium]MDB4086748.1 WbqC family protein [Flavobacteriaceae bacterium]MDB4240528.1 WbqC family protein [Flavobacteriaceae bacterium]MDC0958469.1 WbqC family protein [Flavobacteriaceae bacterium]
MVPPYFGPISYWKQIINSNILWDVHQNYVKQSYRNRTFIHSANGLHKLTIPVKHSKIKFSMLNAEIDNKIAWQKNHWRSIQTAYSSSPFFEFYKDSLEQVYNKKYTYLVKFNFDMIKLIFEWLDIEIKLKLSKEYKVVYDDSLDLRKKIENQKHSISKNKIYNQVFFEKNGFLNDLSIIDLIFNEGPNSLSYLK